MDGSHGLASERPRNNLMSNNIPGSSPPATRPATSATVMHPKQSFKSFIARTTRVLSTGIPSMFGKLARRSRKKEDTTDSHTEQMDTAEVNAVRTAACDQPNMTATKGTHISAEVTGAEQAQPVERVVTGRVVSTLTATGSDTRMNDLPPDTHATAGFTVSDTSPPLPSLPHADVSRRVHPPPSRTLAVSCRDSWDEPTSPDWATPCGGATDLESDDWMVVHQSATMGAILLTAGPMGAMNSDPAYVVSTSGSPTCSEREGEIDRACTSTVFALSDNSQSGLVDNSQQPSKYGQRGASEHFLHAPSASTRGNFAAPNDTTAHVESLDLGAVRITPCDHLQQREEHAATSVGVSDRDVVSSVRTTGTGSVSTASPSRRRRTRRNSFASSSSSDTVESDDALSDAGPDAGEFEDPASEPPWWVTGAHQRHGGSPSPHSDIQGRHKTSCVDQRFGEGPGPYNLRTCQDVDTDMPCIPVIPPLSALAGDVSAHVGDTGSGGAQEHGRYGVAMSGENDGDPACASPEKQHQYDGVMTSDEDGGVDAGVSIQGQREFQDAEGRYDHWDALRKAVFFRGIRPDARREVCTPI